VLVSLARKVSLGILPNYGKYLNSIASIIDALDTSTIKSKLHVISAHEIGQSWSARHWYEKLL
jgi:hypothetical protein